MVANLVSPEGDDLEDIEMHSMMIQSYCEIIRPDKVPGGMGLLLTCIHESATAILEAIGSREH